MTPTLTRRTALLALAVLAAACRQTPSSTPGATSSPPPAAARIAVSVDGDGYHPATVRVRAGRPVTLAFTRTSDEGCGQQVVFPDLGLRRDLPLNEAVEVAVTAPASGRIAFTCGMKMYRGAVVAE